MIKFAQDFVLKILDLVEKLPPRPRTRVVTLLISGTLVSLLLAVVLYSPVAQQLI